MIAFLAALTLGFLGSFHCVGMCGPIALTLPVHHLPVLKRQSGIFLYHFGRILTYSSLGLLFGLLGQSFFPAIFQQALSIGVGVLILLVLILNKTGRLQVRGSALFQRVFGRLASRLSQLFRKKGMRFLLLIGVLNGFLPCGLVYIGLAGAAASGSYLRGSFFMLGFGLGTLPAMYALTFMGRYVTPTSRSHMRKIMPVVAAGMALLLIVRGMNLGIPHLSPKMDGQTQTVDCCHPSKTCATKTPDILCAPKKQKR